MISSATNVHSEVYAFNHRQPSWPPVMLTLEFILSLGCMHGARWIVKKASIDPARSGAVSDMTGATTSKPCVSPTHSRPHALMHGAPRPTVVIRLRSPASAETHRSRSRQVTDDPGLARTLGRTLGERVGGNPSRVRISHPPPR